MQLSASRNGNGVILNWFTLTENNTSHFDLERSVDGVSFVSISKVTAAGSSNTRKNYSLADNALSSSTIYYRVRLNDFDGKKTYSNTVSVITNSVTGQFAVNPNPVSSRYNVTMNASSAGIATLQLVDLSGKTVWTKQYSLQKGTTFVSIERTTEAKGMYVMIFRVNETVTTQKLIINEK